MRTEQHGRDPLARAEVQPHCRLQGPVCPEPTVLWEHLLVTTYQFPSGQDGGWILFALSTRSLCTDSLSALYSWSLLCPGSAEVAAVLTSGSFWQQVHPSPDLQPLSSALRVLLPPRRFDAQSQLDVLSCQLSQHGPSPFQSCHRPRFQDNRGRVRNTSVALGCSPLLTGAGHLRGQGFCTTTVSWSGGFQDWLVVFLFTHYVTWLLGHLCPWPSWEARHAEAIWGSFPLRPLRGCGSLIVSACPDPHTLHFLVATAVASCILAQQASLHWSQLQAEVIADYIQGFFIAILHTSWGLAFYSQCNVVFSTAYKSLRRQTTPRASQDPLFPIWLVLGRTVSPRYGATRQLCAQASAQQGRVRYGLPCPGTSEDSSRPCFLFQKGLPGAKALTFAFCGSLLWPEPLVYAGRPSLQAAPQTKVSRQEGDPPAPILHAFGDTPGGVPRNDGDVVSSCAPELNAAAQITVHVHCPMYLVEAVVCSLDTGDQLPELMPKVRQGLRRLDLPFATELVPVNPQPYEEIAVMILGVSGLDLTGQVIVLLDFRACGGPVDSQFVCVSSSHYELVCLAAGRGLPPWDVYLWGQTEPLPAGSRFRARHGGLIKFMPQNTVPNWGRCLEAILQAAHPTTDATTFVPGSRPDSVLVLDGDRRVPLKRTPFCSGTLREAVAKLVGQPPTRVTVSRPVGDTLRNVVHRGVPCSETIAVCTGPPANNPADRGYFVFLDPRQLGKPPTVIRLRQSKVEIDYLARFADIHSIPQGLCLSLCAAQIDGDYVEVSDGEVVTFGFVRASPVAACLPASSGTVHCAHGPHPAAAEDIAHVGDPPVLVLPLKDHHPDQTVAVSSAGASPANFEGPPTATAKLLQEPTSHTFEARQRIEQVRANAEEAGQPWPYLPAPDEFAAAADTHYMQTSEEEELEVHCLTFVLLTPGYNNVAVPVRLPAPSEIPDALRAVTFQRDPVQSRLYPFLGVVHPQPSNAYGVLYALPLWAAGEPFACFNLTHWDGRFFIECVPQFADLETLLRLADVAPEADIHVYVGNTGEPLGPDQPVQVRPGTCVFYQPRRHPPPPVFHLTDTLLSEVPWQLDPPLPLGLAIATEAYVCAVAETRYQAVGFRQSYPEEDITRVAAAFGLSQHQLILLYAEPPILDVCVKGQRCTNVCSVISASDVPHLTYPDLPNASFLDCRALLQGWHLLIANENTVSFQEFEDSFAVFCPEGWELHIEGLPLGNGGYTPRPKQIAYASYVMQPRSIAPSQGEQADSEVPTDDESVGDTEGEADADSPDRAYQSSTPMRSRSRSPRDTSGPDRRRRITAQGPTAHALSSGARNSQAIGREASGSSPTHGTASTTGQTPPADRARHARHVPARANQEHTEAVPSSSTRPRVWARFLLYAPETAPELIDVQIAQGATVNDAVHVVQRARTRDARLRYPDVFPSELQPLPHLAVAITLPAWCASTYILLDCTRCNGALFCALSSPATTRATLLTIARLPSDTGIEVFVHDRPTRLEDGEVIEMHTGICVNFVPPAHPPFAVARLEDMLEDPHSWDLTADLPHVEGRWIYVCAH